MCVSLKQNAGGSGVAKITVCDSNGFDCDSSDLPYRSKLIKSFYIYLIVFFSFL